MREGEDFYFLRRVRGESTAAKSEMKICGRRARGIIRRNEEAEREGEHERRQAD